MRHEERLDPGSGGLETVTPVAGPATAMGDRDDDSFSVDDRGDARVWKAAEDESPDVVLGRRTRNGGAAAREVGCAGYGTSHLGRKQSAIPTALALVPDDGVLELVGLAL